ncbi:unnamed protein product [Polarella glacialis]|uniref:Uncharacterized protein n=1 Tax=Polarella glacialis TaxID=89957 RepID=A0A813FDM8_POLGL|nr:unnamed protein product [Polarella glacialis]
MFMLLHVMSLLGQSFCCRLRLRRQLLGQRRRLESTVAAAVVLLASVASATESLCFASSEYYSRAFCCRQSPEQLEGNPECWDGAYTFQACCGPDLPQQANHTGITQRDYLQQCAAGAKSDACDAAAERLAQTMRPELAAEVAPQLCRARPELCRLVLLRAWDVQTRRGRAAHWPGRMEGPEAVAWCTQRAADLRALDPNRFAFSGQPAADATESLKRWDQNPFSLWLRHCGQLQALRVAGSLPQSRPTSSAAANNVGVLMAVAGQAAEEYAEFLFFADYDEPEWLEDIGLQSSLGISPQDARSFRMQVSKYAWLKWLSAKRHLENHDISWLIVVDPDMVPTPGCGMQVPIAEAFMTHCCGGDCECDVVSADMWPRDFESADKLNNPGGQDKNAGFTMIRNSEVGHLFLDLILERRWWSGLGMADQDAVGETLLELISLENVEVGGRKYDYRCMNAMFFKPASMQDPERPWAYMSTNYGMCWHRAAQYLAGPIGQRRSCIVGLVSPLLANLNAQPYSDLIWKVPPGGWNMQRSGKLRANFGAGLGAARPSDRWNRGADSMLVVHFAGLGPTKLELMAWGLLAHYGVRPNATCSELLAVAGRLRLHSQPPCRPLENAAVTATGRWLLRAS